MLLLSNITIQTINLAKKHKSFDKQESKNNLI